MVNTVSFITLNDSRRLAGASLRFAGQVVSLQSLDLGDFALQQRKLVFGLGLASGGSAPCRALHAGSCPVSRSSMALCIEQDATPQLELGDIRLCLDDLLIPAGNYLAQLTVWLDSPAMLTRGPVPEKLDLLQYSQVLWVEILLQPAGAPPGLVGVEQASAAYDSFGNLGFFLADLPAMAAIIRREVGDGPVDLLEAFTETGLADTLLEAGVLCLTWGLTPWPYYLFTASSAAERARLPLKGCRRRSGVYRIADGLSELSLVPGEYLRSWPDCLERSWPGIRVAGQGSTLHLDLHACCFQAADSHAGPPLAMFNLYRSEAALDIAPLLNPELGSMLAGDAAAD